MIADTENMIKVKALHKTSTEASCTLNSLELRKAAPGPAPSVELVIYQKRKYPLLSRIIDCHEFNFELIF